MDSNLIKKNSNVKKRYGTLEATFSDVPSLLVAVGIVVEGPMVTVNIPSS